MPTIVERKDGDIHMLSKEIETVSAEKTREMAVNSNEMSLTKLARLSFWESFHQTGKNDWFLTHAQVFDVLKDEPELSSYLSYTKEDSSKNLERLAIVDIGCGTSAVRDWHDPKQHRINNTVNQESRIFRFISCAIYTMLNRMNRIMPISAERAQNKGLYKTFDHKIKTLENKT